MKGMLTDGILCGTTVQETGRRLPRKGGGGPSNLQHIKMQERMRFSELTRMCHGRIVMHLAES